MSFGLRTLNLGLLAKASRDAAALSGAVSVSAAHAYSLHRRSEGDKNGRHLGLLTFMNVLHNKLTKRRIFVSVRRT